MSTCCPQATHDQIKADPKRWEEQPAIGIQPVDAIPGDPAYSLELRNCARCGTTMGKRLP